jgi:hypothetical protein
VTPRPHWDDSFLHDLPAFEKYAAELQAWQRHSDDPFERADAALWSRLNADQACAVFNHIHSRLEWFDATGLMRSARAADNEARRAAGVPEISENEYRTAFCREFAQ